MIKDTAQPVPTNIINIPKAGDIAKGTIIAQQRSSLYIDLGPIGTGVVFGREFYEIKDKLKELKAGDSLTVKIVNLDTDDGYIELSVSEAANKMVWDTLRQIKENGEAIAIKILGANKGGLVTKIEGLPAFLPVSQLKPEHYPKILGGDPDKILKELQKFIGAEMSVKILNLKPQTGEIILSEKLGNIPPASDNLLKNYSVGQIVKGVVSGVMEFGVFVRFGEENIEGLIPLAQIDKTSKQNLSEIFKIGDRINAVISEISDGKVFLALKPIQQKIDN